MRQAEATIQRHLLQAGPQMADQRALGRPGGPDGEELSGDEARDVVEGEDGAAEAGAGAMI